MTVYAVIEWIDGIPETIKLYRDEEGAEQCVRVLGRPNMTVIAMEVH
jgi:hypothetical protein